jgi:putative colanic acid biosynthesis UDP-glucose lipid carrier transferase
VAQTVDAVLRNVGWSGQLPARTAYPVSYVAAGFLAAAIELVVIIATAVACGLAYNLIAHSVVTDYGEYLGIGGLFGVIYLLRMHALGGYWPEALLARRSDVTDILSAWVFAFSVLAITAYLLKIGHVFSRGSVISFALVGLVAVFFVRIGVRSLLRWAREQHLFAERRALLIGEPAELADSHLSEGLSRSGYSLQDVLPLDLQSVEQAAESAVEAAVRPRTRPVQEILLCINWANLERAERILERLRVLPVPVLLVADRRVRAILPNSVSNVGSVLAIEVQRASLTTFEQAMKRTLDVVGAVTGLILLFPLLVIVSLAIKLDSSGPVLFRQTRTGFSGRPFTIYKFRTMTVTENGDVIPQARRNDTRVTRIGRLLRRTSIDELPQLLNVLKGEMSLVGPRPHALAHDNEYTRLIANYSFRHHMKPGITGWAQVCGFRGATPTVDLMEQRLERDLWYINNWSIWLDIKTVLLTTVRVMSQDEAY